MKTYIILLLGSMLCLVACDFSSNTNTPNNIVVEGTPAISDLTQRIENDPDNASLYATRAQIFYDDEQYEAAISDIQNALLRDSMNIAYHHLLADAYFDSNQTRPALATLTKVVLKDSTQVPTLLKLGEMQMILKQYEASLAAVSMVLRQKPRHAEGFFLGGMNFEQMRDTARAITAFQTAVEEDPDHLEAYLKLAGLFDAKDNKIALRYYDNALRIDSTNREALVGQAWYFHQRNQFTQAQQLYKKATAKHPFDEQIHLNNGILHIEMKDYETAYNIFSTAVEVAPQFGLAYYYRAYAGELLKKDIQSIVNDYQQAVAFMPDPQRPSDALARLGEK